MEILKVRYRTTDEFRAEFAKDSGFAALFCPTTTPLTPGEEVIVELSVPALPNKVMIRGKVQSWRPALPRLRVRAGALVEFADDEREKREFVVATVEGKRAPTLRRRHARLPVELAVRYRIPSSTDQSSAELSEISVGGALLKTPSPLPLGCEVIVELTPPGGAAPIEITGRVTYHAGEHTGIKFVYRDGGGSRRIRELIRRLRDR